MTSAVLTDHNLCTGCGLCANTCPHQAISIVRDEGGFLYPQIIDEKCIRCGLCAKICHANDVIKYSRKKAFFGYHTNPDIRAQSSSGGLFTALAETVLEMGGVVYGHVLDEENLRLSCVRAKNEQQLSKMRQSKYVESDITGVYDSMKFDVEHGPVLFCGTPCQCGALRKKFGTNDNLYLVSFVCHGVGSPRCFHEHYSTVKGKKHIDSFYMRDKYFGWHDDTVRIVYKDNNKDYISHYTLDAYYYGYMVLSKFMRDCCYSCQYSDFHPSDIILADFWKIVDTKFPDDNKGTSMVIANTTQGNALISLLNNAKLNPLETEKCNYAFFEIASTNSPEVIERIKEKDCFLEAVNNVGFAQSSREYMELHFFRRKIKVLVKRLLRQMKSIYKHY